MNDAKKEKAAVKRQLTKEKKTNEKNSKQTTILRNARDVARFSIPAATPTTSTSTSSTSTTCTPARSAPKPRPFTGRSSKTQVRSEDVERWAGPIRDALDTRFAPGASVARQLALKKVMEDEMADLDVDGEGASARRYFLAIEKVAGDGLSRVSLLSRLLSTVAPTTVKAALPAPIKFDLVAAAERDLVVAIEANYDPDTCLNIKTKHYMSRRAAPVLQTSGRCLGSKACGRFVSANADAP
jgi:hypothetical protein